jgi:hypothetical protein
MRPPTNAYVYAYPLVLRVYAPDDEFRAPRALPSELILRVRSGYALFTEVFERNLYPIIIHLLEVLPKLLTTLRASGEKLRYMCYWRAFRSFNMSRRSHVDQPIKIIIDNVVVHCANVDAARWLVPDAQHLCPVANGWNVLIAPSAILEHDAACCRTVAIEPNPLGFRSVSVEAFRIGHLYGSDEVDRLAHVFPFGCVGRTNHNTENQAGEQNVPS